MRQLLLLALLLLFAGTKSFSQTMLPFALNQIQMDYEQDSLCYYRGPSKTYVVAARLPFDPDYNKGKRIVERGMGKEYTLWTYVSDYSVMDYLGLKDKQNRVYWLDNKTHTLSMYRNETLIWKNNVLLATFCASSGVVYRLQLRKKLIYVWDGTAWAGYDRRNGKERDGGSD